MAEKTRYSDAELEEFRAIILDKLEKAKRDYEMLRSGVTNSDGNDVADTSPTFDFGASFRTRFIPFQRRSRPTGTATNEIHTEFAGSAGTY